MKTMGYSYKDLRRYCYFSSLSDGALKAISNKLQEVTFPAGALIITEGEPADSFYLICSGEVEVLKTTREGQQAKISVINQGEGFGEMALLTCSPRFCSVRAITDVQLLRLSKSDFDEIVNMDSAFAGMVKRRTESYSQFNRIKTLGPFALLPPEKMTAIIDVMVEERYPAGVDIIKQGERGDTYYVIRSGEVLVLKKTFDDDPKEVAMLSDGDAFGEEALITDSPRNATIRTLKDTVVWTISREHFDRIIKASFLQEISPEDVLGMDQGDLHYLDVRMEFEFHEEHIPGAINIPLDELRKRYKELDPEREYYVYCLVGARSASATFILNSRGIKAKSIRGGLSAWPGPTEEGSEGIHTPWKPT